MANLTMAAETIYKRMQTSDAVEFGVNLGCGLAGAGIAAGFGQGIKDAAAIGGWSFAGSALLTKVGRLVWGNKRVLTPPAA